MKRKIPLLTACLVGLCLTGAAGALFYVLAMLPPAPVAVVAPTVPVEPALARIKKSGTIRCGYAALAPFFTLDPMSKNLAGFYKDMTDAVLAASGWTVDYVPVASGAEIETLQAGHIDAMCGAGPYDAAAQASMASTAALVYVTFHLYARADDTRFNAAADANKLDVAVAGIDGDVSLALARRFSPLAKIQAMPATAARPDLITALIGRKTDVVITDNLSAITYNAHNLEKIKALSPQQPLAVYGMEFTVLKSDADLLALLNGYSAAAVGAKKIDPILQRYDPNGLLFAPSRTVDAE